MEMEPPEVHFRRWTLSIQELLITEILFQLLLFPILWHTGDQACRGCWDYADVLFVKCQWWCLAANSRSRLNNWGQIAWKRKEGLHVQQQGELLCQTCRSICWIPKWAWLSIEIVLPSSSRCFRAWEMLDVGIPVVFLTGQMSLYNCLVCSLALWIFPPAKWRVSTDIQQRSSPFLFHCLQTQPQNAATQSFAPRGQSPRMQNRNVCHWTSKHNKNENSACFQFSDATSLWKIVSILLMWDNVQQAAAAQQLMSLHTYAEASRVLSVHLDSRSAAKLSAEFWGKKSYLKCRKKFTCFSYRKRKQKPL